MQRLPKYGYSELRDYLATYDSNLAAMAPGWERDRDRFGERPGGAQGDGGRGGGPPGDRPSADAGRGNPTGPPHSGGDETRNRDYPGRRWEERRKPREQTVNLLDELPEYCTEDEEAAQLCTLVEVAHASTADAQLPFSLLIQVAEALEEVGIPPEKLRQLAGLQSETDPDADIVHDLLQAGLTEVARNQGLNAAKAYLSLVQEFLANARLQVSPDLEVDDIVVTSKTMPDGTTRSSQKLLRGTLKDVMRALRATVPLSKLLAADRKIREYLLYYAISVASAMS